jgi:predicted SAM-dependent methyltransferase
MTNIKKILKKLPLISALVIAVRSIQTKFGLKNKNHYQLKVADKFEEYRESLPKGESTKVIFGGHWASNPNWLVLTESEQDITKKLDLPDESFDIVFTEHVLEHLSFNSAIHFLREAQRILKKGGTIRIVCPMIESLLAKKLDSKNGRLYVKNSLISAYPDENAILSELNLNGIEEDPETFLLNSIFREHGHKFIWSNHLLQKVMSSLGYKNIRNMDIGITAVPGANIERRRRGVYLGNDWQEELKSTEVFDPESMVIEAQR